jgi:hypothetical protein
LHLCTLAVFGQVSFSGKLLYGWSLGREHDKTVQNHRIDDSALLLTLTPFEFIQVHIGMAAPHDAVTADLTDRELEELIRLYQANISVDLLNSLGQHSIPLGVTLTVGLVDKQDIDPAKISMHELEDVSQMELADWAVCLDLESGLLGLRIGVATSQLDKPFPHTLVSFFGHIDPFKFELAFEAFDNGESASAHAGASLGLDFYLNENLSLAVGVDTDMGFIPQYSELFSWGAAASLDYTSGGLRSRASLALQGRGGIAEDSEVSGELLRAFSAAAQLWPVELLGMGTAAVWGLSGDMPWYPLNTEFALLLQLGPVSMALGYLLVPEAAAGEDLAGVLVWATRLTDSAGRHVSGVFFTFCVEF